MWTDGLNICPRKTRDDIGRDTDIVHTGKQTYVQLTTQIVMLLLVHSTIRLFLLVLPEIEEGLT